MSLLEIVHLKKSYPSPDGQRQVIDIPAFSLEAQKELAICGESGSGKTTFLNLIAGIVAADAGTIRIGETEMSALNEAGRDRLRARNVGYIFQNFNLLQGFSCIENVLLGMAFGGNEDRDRAAHLLERVGLQKQMQHFPKQLSVGQQQRVAVARALAASPKLVLADEPTGNLDPQNARQSLSLIRETCNEIQASLLLVSHDQNVLHEFESHFDLMEINRAHHKGGGR